MRPWKMSSSFQPGELKRSNTAASQRGSVIGGLFRWLFFALLAFVLVTAVSVLLLRWLHPVTSAFMLEARLHAALTGDSAYRTDFEWVNLEQISSHAAVAGHRLGRPAVSLPRRLRLQVDPGVRAREASAGNGCGARARFPNRWRRTSFSGRAVSLRKALEAYFTVLIEAMWPKERILEMYLNIAEFGHGVYGVEAAAQRFYHKPAARLTSSEAATLAAVLPNPVKLRADRPSAYVQSRRDWIPRPDAGPGRREVISKRSRARTLRPGKRGARG